MLGKFYMVNKSELDIDDFLLVEREKHETGTQTEPDIPLAPIFIPTIPYNLRCEKISNDEAKNIEGVKEVKKIVPKKPESAPGVLVLNAELKSVISNLKKVSDSAHVKVNVVRHSEREGNKKLSSAESDCAIKPTEAKKEEVKADEPSKDIQQKQDNTPEISLSNKELRDELTNLKKVIDSDQVATKVEEEVKISEFEKNIIKYSEKFNPTVVGNAGVAKKISEEIGDVEKPSVIIYKKQENILRIYLSNQELESAILNLRRVPESDKSETKVNANIQMNSLKKKIMGCQSLVESLMENRRSRMYPDGEEVEDGMWID